MEQSFILPKGMNWTGRIAQIGRFLEGLSIRRNWEVRVREKRSARSDDQNRYLNGCAYKLIGEAIGYERDDVSEFLCGAYFGWREKRVPKKPSCPEGIESVPIRTTTTDETGRRDVLTWDQFADFVAFVQRFAAKKGIHIPDPDPNWRESEQREAA
jgi:hypothetical protein